jgi:hypothetical protein
MIGLAMHRATGFATHEVLNQPGALEDYKAYSDDKPLVEAVRVFGAGDLVQHVGGLVNPTALVPGAREDLFDRLPEAERAVADREVRSNLEPTLPDVDEELTPALRTFAHPGLEADEFLLALGCRANQHQHAFGGRLHGQVRSEDRRWPQADGMR